MSANNRLKKAIIERDLDGVKAAISDGANVNKPILNGGKPSLELAIVSLGIEYLSAKNSSIGLCLQKGTPEILKALLDAGADPNPEISMAIYKKDSKNKEEALVTSVLGYMIYNHQEDFVRVLLESKKINPTKTFLVSGSKKNVMGYAREKGNKQIVEMFESYIVDFLEADKQRQLKEFNVNEVEVLERRKEEDKEIPSIVNKFPTVFNPAKKTR